MMAVACRASTSRLDRIGRPHHRGHQADAIARQLPARRLQQRRHHDRGDAGDDEPEPDARDATDPLAHREGRDQGDKQRDRAGDENAGLRRRRQGKPMGHQQDIGRASADHDEGKAAPAEPVQRQPAPPQHRQQDQPRRPEPQRGQIFRGEGAGHRHPCDHQPARPDRHRQQRQRAADQAPDGVARLRLDGPILRYCRLKLCHDRPNRFQPPGLCPLRCSPVGQEATVFALPRTRAGRTAIPRAEIHPIGTMT